MHKAITILMFKLECQVIDRNPDFQMQGRDFLRHIDWKKGTVTLNGEKEYPPAGYLVPHGGPRRPGRTAPG